MIRTEREKEILDGIIDIIKKYLNPNQIILFGWRAKGKFSKGADFDIAVDAKKPNISILREINEKIEEICGLYKIDIVYLPNVDKKFREIVIETGKVIYEKRS